MGCDEPVAEVPKAMDTKLVGRITDPQVISNKRKDTPEVGYDRCLYNTAEIVLVCAYISEVTRLLLESLEQIGVRNSPLIPSRSRAGSAVRLLPGWPCGLLEEITVAIGPHRVPPSLPPEASSGPQPQSRLAPHPGPHSPDFGAGTGEGKDSSGVSGHRSSTSPLSLPGPPEDLQLCDCLLGWELWPAAWRLAAFIASDSGAKLMRHAEAVVELGAGLGLPGIIAAKVGAKNVTLTDLPQALPLLAANVELNAVDGACRTAVLDWSQLAVMGGSCAVTETHGAVVPEPELRSRKISIGQPCRQQAIRPSEGGEPGGGRRATEHVGAYDVVLAADVVYVCSLVPLLADTIAAVCCGDGAVALVGHTIRKSVWLDRATGKVCTDASDEPWEAFVKRMTELHGFSCERIRDEATTSDEGVRAVMPPDTFIYAFTRH
ncbi:hypothetical protein VOLCADRAFT_104655 [Volvox carteri f. nagariensis]|uniref:Uncharacterized protein n=1 Tax=Volvox carteri f. nagariensis TaxID=3068 RepID=D8TVL2_VOLCA|nr:uncharacterized protein VOLCADRAFT_104655 [Volvox carteri f. nagariensis]EFJ48601.1 hypothetical protein VOLCADRAFT_104655 [Volvox carteri f. nagariensis]|eukprot:XP_002950400.1 hypothetical protein VOLCADRAFT_104655 [Volvox carteri f. nagariensis]